MQKHKWHKEIKAWADGAEIESREGNSGWWVTNNPRWYEETEYRIKPQPKQPQYLYVYWGNDCSNGYHHFISNKSGLKEYKYLGKIKLEVDDDTSRT